METHSKPAPKSPSKRLGPAHQDKRGYWQICLRGKKQALHRLIYEQAHGPIPAGHVIHHKDEDKANCSLANLMCLPNGAHSSRHNLGLRPSHVVLPDGTIGKLCRLCHKVKPLKLMVACKTLTGGRAFKPYCKSCHYWTYGWGKWLREQQP